MIISNIEITKVQYDALKKHFYAETTGSKLLPNGDITVTREGYFHTQDNNSLHFYYIVR